jgi:hypothetical protein
VSSEQKPEAELNNNNNSDDDDKNNNNPSVSFHAPDIIERSVCQMNCDCHSVKWSNTSKFITNQLTNSVSPEPEGSSPYSQESATGLYPEPTGSNLHSPSQSP